MPAVECYGLAPVDYEGEAYPASIAYSIYGVFLFTFLMVVFVLWDYFTRRSLYSSEVRDGEKKPVKLIQPFFLWGLVIYVLGNSIVSNVISITMFYSLRTFAAGHEMACYLAYYTSGGLNDILYGNSNILITPIFLAYLLLILLVLRPKIIERETETMVKFLSSLPVAECSEKVKFMYVGAAEAVRPISYAEGFEEIEVYKNRGFHITCSDVYGCGDGQTAIEARLVECNIARRGLQHCMSAMTIPPVVEPNSIDKVRFPETDDETYDIIVLSPYLGMQAILDMYFEKDDSYIRNGRSINMMIQLNRIIKPTGYVVMSVDTIQNAETIRRYMRKGGFKTNVNIQHGVSKTLPLPDWMFGGKTFTYTVQSDKYFVIAQKDVVTDEEVARTERMSSLSDIQTKANNENTVIRCKEEAEEDELTQWQWLRLWILYILISLASYIAFLALTIRYFDQMRFPTQMGFVNYFSFVMLGIAQNSVITLSAGVFILRYLVLRLPRITFDKVFGLATKLFIGEYFLGMLYTLPGWVSLLLSSTIWFKRFLVLILTRLRPVS